MELGIYLAIAGVVLVIFIFQSIRYRIQQKNMILRKLEDAWGNRPDREYTYEEFEGITHYFLHSSKEKDYVVDDITWNDLDMDSIFMLLNNTNSSVGEEYLYNLLRTPIKDEEQLKERNRLIEYFYSHKETSIEFGKKYTALGRTKKFSIYQYIQNLTQLGKRSNLKHIASFIMLLASIGLLLVFPPVGIVAVLCTITFNVVMYYKYKAEVENYFICFKYIVHLILTAEEIADLNITELKEYNDKLRVLCANLKSLKKGSSLLTSNNATGNLVDIIMDYFRMVTHIDLMKFNSMLGYTLKHMEDVTKLYETLGFIESMKAAASFRGMTAYYTVPKFHDKKQLAFEDIYHPMIDEPVANSLNEDKPVLLTGSNASGKSTFLKSIAINAVLAQTIYTCMAKEYKTPFYDIYTSMALRDDLENNESYYIVEIKSLKRIIDKVKEGRPVLCFVDEVLRGTNTVERIAASSCILRMLAQSQIMCFAATHDIELTHILERYFSNYHFQEEVKDNQVIFNYILYGGRAVSRNAIKLLGVMGYDKQIIENAEKSAINFLQNGIWDNFS